jgi:hypothetical protein
MSDFNNPYQSPETTAAPETSNNTGILLTETMLRFLYEASPWLRFIGILGYIGCGFMVLGGLLGGAGFAAMFSTLGLSSGLGGIISVAYLALAALFFFPAHFTFMFGYKIRNFRFSNSTEDLELAFKNNKSFWKFIGILSIIYLALIPFAFIFAIIGSVMSLF